MKVYIVTSGEYSGYGIEAVFTNEEQAELYCAIHPYCEIDEWEADKIKISPVDVYAVYEIRFDDKLKEIDAKSHLSIKSEKKVEIFENQYPYSACPQKPSYKVSVPVKKGTQKERAVKIARDYLYQYLMEQLDNEKAEVYKAWQEAGAV